MKQRTAREEKHAGMRLIIVGVIALVVLLALWWLVDQTNSEGDHDAELLPLFSLIPLLLAVFHLLRARFRAAR